MSYEEFCSINNLPQRGDCDYAYRMFNFFDMRYVYERYELTR